MFHFFQIILKNNLYNNNTTETNIPKRTIKNFDFINFNLNINKNPKIVSKSHRYIGRL